MFLTTAISGQNTYTLVRPYTKDGKLTGYAKILIFMDAQDKAWNRLDLIKEVLKYDLTKHRFANRGTMCNIFATMNANDILTYSNRVWKKGKNFEAYMNKYLLEYRA